MNFIIYTERMSGLGRWGGWGGGGDGEDGEDGGDRGNVRSNDFSRCFRVMALAITRPIEGSTACWVGNWSDRLISRRYLANAK
ncbi:hypothetical protein [Laspinema olomoucense]|uniref:hypothetical protein n=1 Tax=Laspinema olomoucense TaxID=3231600 RepID=UPI0021BB0E4B|nr:hypothetical protein [Laspinema sp. D3c]MCT7993304.1 hypothetical protein [Laspinema sp. D3c]